MVAVTPLEPFGATMALTDDAFSEERMPKTQAAVGRAVAKHGMVVLSGVGKMTADEMVELMTVFGPAEGMLDFSGTPRDPEADGSSDFVSAAVPGQNRVRLLGNATDAAGRPAALLADIGYEWHQDASTLCYSMLFCRRAPSAGAETLFADSAKMFQRLSPAQQEWALQTEAVFSNEFTAGGPAAFDAVYGLRMNPTGTRVIRSASRRRENWELGSYTRRLAGRDAISGAAYLWAGAKNIHHIPGLGIDESRDKVQELLETAIGPLEVGELDEDLQTVTPTRFDPEVVQPVEWSVPCAASTRHTHRLRQPQCPNCCHYSHVSPSAPIRTDPPRKALNDHLFLLVFYPSLMPTGSQASPVSGTIDDSCTLPRR